MFSACRCAHSACSVMPGRSCRCITRHRRLAGRERAAHRLDLVGRLDRARELHDLLAVVHAEPCAPRARRRPRGRPCRARAGGCRRRGRAPARRSRPPSRGVLGHPLAAVEEVPAAPRPHLVDQLEMGGQMRAAVEVEHDDRAVGRDEGVAHRVVQAPDLHVGAVGGIAHVDRVADHDAGVVARGQLRAQPGEAVRRAAPPDPAARGRAPATRRARARPARGRRTSRGRAGAPRGDDLGAVAGATGVASGRRTAAAPGRS